MLRYPRLVRTVWAALVPMLVLAAAPSHPAATRCLFDVADLVTPSGTGPIKLRLTPESVSSSEANRVGDSLAERVKSAVVPSSWVGHGSTGTIAYRPDDRTLLVEQSPAVQRQVLDFLRRLRRDQDTAVVLETLAVSVSKETAERLGLVFDTTQVSILDEDQFTRVKRLIFDETQETVLNVPTTSCWSGQAIDVRLDQKGIDVEFSMAPTVSADRQAVRPNLRLPDDRYDGKPFQGVIPQRGTLVLPGRAVTRRLHIPASIPDGARLFNGARRERAERSFVFLTPRVLPRTDAERAEQTTLRDRILEEVDEMGSASTARRESASRRLWKIGQPALGIVSSMARFERPKRWEIMSRFCREMQEKYGVVPVRGDGLEVEPVVPLVWAAPPPGGKTTVRLALKVTNVGKKPISFNPLGTITPIITTSDGVWERLQGLNRDHIARPKEVFAPLEPGESYTDEIGRFELHADADGQGFSVSMCDLTDGWGSVRGLKRGRNYVSFQVENFGSLEQTGLSDLEKPTHPLWFGEVHSALVCIEIR